MSSAKVDKRASMLARLQPGKRTASKTQGKPKENKGKQRKTIGTLNISELTSLLNKSLYLELEDLGHLARNPKKCAWIPQHSKLSF